VLELGVGVVDVARMLNDELDEKPRSPVMRAANTSLVGRSGREP
jgi:hypothetical protein